MNHKYFPLVSIFLICVIIYFSSINLPNKEGFIGPIKKDQTLLDNASGKFNSVNREVRKKVQKHIVGPSKVFAKNIRIIK